MTTKALKPIWMNFSLIVISGLCLGLSQPLVIGFLGTSPVDTHGLLCMLSLVGYAPIIYLLRNASTGRAFFLGFTASLIHFSITFYWIFIALTVFGGVSYVASLAILLLMSAILACYIATAFAAAQFLHLRFGFAHYLIVPGCVCAVEYMRNFGFVGGFPWGNVGYAISQNSVFLQTASVVGVYGLVFIVVMLNALLAEFSHSRLNIVKISRKRAILFAVIYFGMLAFGSYRIADGFDTNGPVLRVALLQGNIEQGVKNKADIYANEIIARYRQLQEEAVSRGAQLVIWPESAYPFSIQKTEKVFKDIGDAASATVIGSIVHSDGIFHNAAVVLDKHSRIGGQYYKSHLVPFGEYVPWPFRNIAAKVVPNLGTFMPGNEYRPVFVQIDDDLKVGLGLTICYEGVFPEVTRAHAANGADLLVNLTNDAWYGVSSAPFQHLHMYRLRSVETGLPFVRATNTGVSAWVDTFGFVHNPTELYEKALVLADVPLVKKKTVYMYIGDIVAQLSLVFVLLALVLGLVGRDVFLRRRDLAEWVLGAAGLAFVLWSGWHFADAKAALDESALTKQTFASAYGLLVMVCAWGGGKVGRRALIIVSVLMMVLSFLIGLSEGYEYWAMTALAAAACAIALFRAKAYE